MYTQSRVTRDGLGFRSAIKGSDRVDLVVELLQRILLEIYLIQILVSVMSHCSQTFVVDFLEFLLKRRHFKNFMRSANKVIKNNKFNSLMIKK